MIMRFFASINFSDRMSFSFTLTREQSKKGCRHYRYYPMVNKFTLQMMGFLHTEKKRTRRMKNMDINLE